MLSPQTGPILLVDDRRENLLALSTVLRDEGYELVEALSGQEAISHAEKRDFVAILMDVQMPILDGFQTAQILRRNGRHKNTPILFVTAIHRTEDYEQRGYSVGAVDYIFKPINTNILKAKLSIFSELFKQKYEIQKQAIIINEKAVEEKENELLKQSLRARDQFLSMASHELKTPITPLNLQLQAFLEMIDEGTFTKTDPVRLRRMLETSYSQVERLSKTIDNLLDVSRFTTGQMVLQKERVDLSALAEKVLNSFAAQMKEVGCEFTLETEPDVVGYWDPFRIEQIFINLLSNSMKYGAGKPVLVRVRKRDNKAEMQVIDNGIGIAPEDQDRIFNRFERAVSPEFYGGLGLGLFISCEIVRLHHGSIGVQSNLGSGAKFTVKLPI